MGTTTTARTGQAGTEKAGRPEETGPRLADQPVSALRTAPAVAVVAEMHLDVALAVMATSDVRHVAVLDEAGCCVGVLSDRAVTAAWAWNPAAFAGRRVGELTQPVVARTTATVGAVASLMRERDVDAVPIVDDEGQVDSVVTAVDLVAAIDETT